MKFLCPNCKAKYQIGPEKLVGRRIAKIRCRKCDYRIQIAPRAGSEEYDITATPTSLAPASGGSVSGGSVPVGAASLVPAAASPALPPAAPLPAAALPAAPAASPGPSPAGLAPAGLSAGLAPKPAPAPRIPLPGAPGARAGVLPRARGAEKKEDSSGASGTRKPTAAVPGLPGLGASKLTRSAGARTDLFGAAAPLGARRPLAAPPGGAVASAALTPAAAPVAAPPAPVAPLALAPEMQPVAAPAAAPFPPTPKAMAAAPLPVPVPPPGAPAPAAIAPPPGPAPARPAAAGTQLADQFRQSVQAGGAGTAVEEGPQDGWFVGVNGVPLGPIPVADLRELASAGHIDRKSLVWREGQAEWRPLGKFPFLARLLEDGSAASSPRPASPEPGESATARGGASAATGTANGVANGASNGQIATGFAAARPAEPRAERPSAWGDLDEDDDEQEQPTTVKGRVSVPPPPQAPAPGRAAAPGSPPAALPGLPPAPQPPVPRVEAPLAGQGPASSTGAVSVPPSAAVDLGLLPAVSAAPAAEDADARLLQSKGRKRKLVLGAAVVALVAVGAVAWHLMSAPSAKTNAPPPHALAADGEQEKKAEAPPPATPPPAAPSGQTAENPATAPPAEPATPPVTKPAPAPAPAAPSAAERAAPAKPASSLLSGLNTLQTPGPAAGTKSSGAGPAAGPGLEATAIQRTVRKYSPAVRQNCWQRALNARAPGVPSSAKVTATITVDGAGHVQSVTATGAPRGYPGLAHCIEEAVKGWAFPRSVGETVTQVPFMFVGQ